MSTIQSQVERSAFGPAGRRFTLLRVALGGGLLVAAALKAHGLVLDPVSQDSFLATPRLQVAVIEAEILLGLWLLSGWAKRAAWAVALVFFACLGGVSLYLAMQGQSSCGCFGRVQVNPWLTFGVDAAIVAALLLRRPLAIEAFCIPDRSASEIAASPPRRRFGLLWKTPARPTDGRVFLFTTSALTAVLLVSAATVFLLSFDNPADTLARWRGESLTLTPNPAAFGEGPRGSSHNIVLQVRNHTEEPIRVIGGTADCNCVTTADLPVEVPPHGTAEVRISVKLSGTPGLFRRPFELYTDAENQFRVTGWLIGRIRESHSQAKVQSPTKGDRR